MAMSKQVSASRGRCRAIGEHTKAGTAVDLSDLFGQVTLSSSVSLETFNSFL